VYYLKNVVPPLSSTAPKAKSLASHMISTDKLQFDAMIIDAVVNFSFNVSNAFKHSLEKLNGAPFINKITKKFGNF